MSERVNLLWTISAAVVIGYDIYELSHGVGSIWSAVNAAVLGLFIFLENRKVLIAKKTV